MKSCHGILFSHAPVTLDENIEVDKVGIVIGTKGSMITDIMKRSGAKILINQDFPKGQPHRIVYSGTSPIQFLIATWHSSSISILHINSMTSKYAVLIGFLPFLFRPERASRHGKISSQRRDHEGS